MIGSWAKAGASGHCNSDLERLRFLPIYASSESTNERIFLTVPAMRATSDSLTSLSPYSTSCFRFRTTWMYAANLADSLVPILEIKRTTSR